MKILGHAVRGLALYGKSGRSGRVSSLWLQFIYPACYPSDMGLSGIGISFFSAVESLFPFFLGWCAAASLCGFRYWFLLWGVDRFVRIFLSTVLRILREEPW